MITRKGKREELRTKCGGWSEKVEEEEEEEEERQAI
jgi:hypothetical protein